MKLHYYSSQEYLDAIKKSREDRVGKVHVCKDTGLRVKIGSSGIVRVSKHINAARKRVQHAANIVNTAQVNSAWSHAFKQGKTRHG